MGNDYTAVVAEWREPGTKRLHRSILHTSPSYDEAVAWSKVHAVGRAVRIKTQAFHPPHASVRKFTGKGASRRMVSRAPQRIEAMVR